MSPSGGLQHPPRRAAPRHNPQPANYLSQALHGYHLPVKLSVAGTARLPLTGNVAFLSPPLTTQPCVTYKYGGRWEKDIQEGLRITKVNNLTKCIQDRVKRKEVVERGRTVKRCS